MMEALTAILDFIKWAFRDGNSAFVSVIVIYAVFHGISHVIESIKGEKHRD